MSLFSRTIVAGAGAALAIAISTSASAQDWRGGSGSGSSSWRSHGHGKAQSDLWNFTLELRFGAYYPQIDEIFAADPAYPCGGPYECYFGKGAQFYFGLELDWLPVRIPYVGKIGPSFGWGFVTANAKSHSVTSTDWSGGSSGWQTTTDATTSETTNITLFPMHASAALRIDEISRRTVLPIVPYAKLGFGFGKWTSGTSRGTSKIGKDDATIAEGMSYGPHVALGGMLGLNWLDRRSSTMARQTTGIDAAYLFGEWMFDKLSYGIGKPGMHIGTSTWVVGLALDL